MIEALARPFRVMIADDEAPARRQIYAFLRDKSTVTVVAECRTGRQAIEAIQQHKPDLVFLDIQMPGTDGFGVIEAIGVDNMPSVIFVTAYDSYAVRAFEVHAIDYLLKPCSRERFEEALARVGERLGRNAAERRIHLRSLLRDLQYHPATRPQPNQSPAQIQIERLVVKSGEKIVSLKLSEVIWLEAEDHYVRIHTKDARYLVHQKLSALEASLPASSFARIHRGAIVNLTHVEHILTNRLGACYLHMSSGEKLRISRGRRDSLKAILSM